MSRTFRSLKVPNFRWYAGAALVANTAMWMQRIDQDWLAVKLTHDGVAVGITTALQFLPILLVGPFAGVFADRLPKRPLLVASCATMGLPALVLGAFITLKMVTVWHIYGCALVLGIASSIDAPARMAYLRELLGRDELVNAIGLSQVNFHTSRIIGPTLAGFVIAATGIGPAFFLVGAFFLMAAALLTGIRAMDPAAFDDSGLPKLAPGLGGAVRELLHQPALIAVTLLAMAVCSFALNFQVSLTLMATQVFKLPAGGFGSLTSMMAMGSITGALLVARLRKPSYVVVLGTATGLGLAYLVAVRANSPFVFGLILTPIGLLSNMFLATSNAVVQLRSDPRLQGRMTGLYMAVTNALAPLGAVAIGAGSDRFSPRAPLAFAGVMCIVGGLAAFAALLALGAFAWDKRRLVEVEPVKTPV